jgi:two-component sensor histidine kinase
MPEDDPQLAQAPLRDLTGDDVALTATLTIDPGPESGAAVRAFVRTTLAEWSVDEAAANAALDVAHELASNAIQHGRPPIELTLSRTPAELLVVCADSDPDLAHRLPYRPGVSERGLGLRLVAQLSDEWGQHSRDGGKEVWAAFRGRRRLRRH